MSWYTTECLYRADVSNGVANGYKQLFEYRYFLLQAENDESATEKALTLGQRKQHAYSNAEGKQVNWILERVVDTKEVLDQELTEGTEIYHKYMEDGEVAV